MTHRYRALAPLFGVLALAAGCAGVQPDRIVADRMDYGQVIAESWKRQTLLNVVRLRYGDAPVFLEVASVINSYSVTGKATAGAALPTGIDPNVFSLGGEGTWSNTPTVTYQPLIGDRFSRSLLRPIPPSAVFQLLQAGWPVDLVMSTVVNSINGVRNESFWASGDSAFPELVGALKRIQRAGAVGIRVDPQKDGGAAVLVLRRAERDGDVRADERRVRELLKLDDAVVEFDVNYALLPQRPNQLAVLSRSMLEIMVDLGIGIDLPPAHRDDGRAAQGNRPRPQADALVRIQSATVMPTDSFAAVQYKGHWYWIDDTDIASKRTFTFLLILFSLAETGQSVAAPVVTVPSR